MASSFAIPNIGTDVFPREIQRAALATFRGLGREKQFLLVQEVVNTREKEMHLAYPAVLSVCFGFKTRRVKTTGKKKLIRTPCVVFEVNRKKKINPASTQLIPRFIFEYIGEPGTRSLCAVPTDVKETVDFGRPLPHDNETLDSLPYGIAVNPRNGDADATAGAVACIVTRRSTGNSRYAISCRHVLSRSLDEDPDVAQGCEVNGATASWPLIGKTLAIRGKFVSFPATSFDAQLIQVSRSDGLRAPMSGIKFALNDAFLTGPQKIINNFWVATPRADANGQRVLVRIEFQNWVRRRPMPYSFDGRQDQVAHTLAIHGVAFDGGLKPGDSGSPAIFTRGGKMLLGMYLGGDGTNAYFIPAWQLLSPGNYGLDEADWSIENFS